MKNAEIFSDCPKTKNEVRCLSVSIISEEFQRQFSDSQSNVLPDKSTRYKTKGSYSLHTNHEVKSNADGDTQGQISSQTITPKMTMQVVASFFVGLSHLGTSTIYGFSGVTLPQLTQPDSSDIYLTPNNAALFGSIVHAGTFCGGILAGPIITRIGLRKSLLLALPMSLALWLLLAFSPGVIILLVARMGTGIMAAPILTTANTYVLEISHKAHRGVLYGSVAISRQCGFLLIYSLGISSLTWRQQALICSMTSIIPFIALIFFPESPRWLVTRGREEEAKKSLVFFRGTQYDSQTELNDIIHQVNAANRRASNNQCAQLFEKSNFKLFLSLMLLSVLVSWNGSFPVMSYIVPIFQSSGTNIDPYMSSIVVGGIRVIGTIIFVLIIEHTGRKQLQMCIYTVMALSLGLFGAYLYLQNNEWVSAHLNWLPLTSILIYTVFLGAGQPVIFMVQGELVPTNIRSLGLSILTAIIFLGAFIVVFVFPILSTTLGDFVAFWAFGISCFLTTVVTYIAIPETKGLSLEDINKKHINEGNL